MQRLINNHRVLLERILITALWQEGDAESMEAKNMVDALSCLAHWGETQATSQEKDIMRKLVKDELETLRYSGDSAYLGELKKILKHIGE